jgi:hypothetical protein
LTARQADCQQSATSAPSIPPLFSPNCKLMGRDNPYDIVAGDAEGRGFRNSVGSRRLDFTPISPRSKAVDPPGISAMSPPSRMNAL